MKQFPHLEFWEERFFEPHLESTSKPIPVTDTAAYTLFPKEFTWVYNKLALYDTQCINAVPHGVPYNDFPAFSKPITNLYGMSVGTKRIDQWDDNVHYTAGHLLMPILSGTQYSSDFVIEGGIIKWSCSLICNKDSNGSFTDFQICCLPEVEFTIIQEFITTYFHNFTGVLNIEILNGVIIECHLRMSTQFVSLYGHQWLDQVIKLYNGTLWDSSISPPREGISRVLRVTGEPFVRWNKCDVEELEYQSGTYIMICGINETTFSSKIDDGFSTRIAIINSPSVQGSELVEEILWDILEVSY